MGVVYRATQLALDRTVALKVIAPGLLEDQTVRNRFVRESKVAASIDHPNVIPIYYAGEEDGIAYIAMRYVAGDDIRSLVRREGHLDPQRAARLVAQLGSALDEAHAAGLVHRDIKPANVLLTSEDHVYLTDFGLTKHALSVAGSTKPGHWVGTLDYVAPEQIRGERVDARADVYALGCLLFYALTGDVPFKRESDEARLWAHLSEPPPKPSEHGVPDAFDPVIERALAKDPEERYPSAGDLGRAALAAAANRRPTERERLVAKGAAAPIESPTVTAAAMPEAGGANTSRLNINLSLRLSTSRRRTSGAMPCSEPVSWSPPRSASPRPSRSASGTTRRPRRARRPRRRPRRPPRPSQAGLTADDEIRVGRRPNVVRVVGDNVFVGSFQNDRLNLVSTKTGKVRSYAPRVGVGVNDASVSGNSVWLAVGRDNQLVRLNAETGRPIGNPIKLPAPASAVAATKNAVWVVLQPGNGAPDKLIKIDPRTGQTVASVDYAWGIGSITTSPTAVWVAARRRARIQRVDPATGEVVKTIQVGRSRSQDIVYRAGSLWLATPEDNAVYKVSTSTGKYDPDQRRPGTAPARGRQGQGLRHQLQLERPLRDRHQALTRRGHAARAVGEPVLARRRRRHDLGRQRAREPPDQGHRSRRVITPVRSA